MGQLLAVPGVAQALPRLLGAGDAALAAEAAWVLTYLTAASAGHLQRLVQAGLVPPLLDRLIGARLRLVAGRCCLQPASACS